MLPANYVLIVHVYVYYIILPSTSFLSVYGVGLTLHPDLQLELQLATVVHDWTFTHGQTAL